MRRYSLSLFTMVVVALAAPTAFAETVAGSVRKGNALYREGKYEEALKEYEAAQVESPDDGRIMFNLGGAQYKLENYERALSEFMKAAPAADETMSARSRYNVGNAFYRAGRLEDAVEQYLATLEIDPDDEDAKHNLEFVRREIERRMKQQQERQEQEQEQEQQQQEPGDSDDSGEMGEPQPQDQESQDRDGSPPEKDQQQEQNAPEQETDSRPETSPEQNQNEQPEPPEKGSEPGHSMSDENLQRWLDAVEAESAENMKEFLRKQQPAQVVVYPEDW